MVNVVALHVLVVHQLIVLFQLTLKTFSAAGLVVHLIARLPTVTLFKEMDVFVTIVDVDPIVNAL